MSNQQAKEREINKETQANKKASKVLKNSPRYGLYKVLRDCTSYFSEFVDGEVDKASLAWLEAGEHCDWCCDASFDEDDPIGECGGCQGFLVRFTTVGTQDFYRDIAADCNFCGNHRDCAALAEVGCDRRQGALEDAVYLADELHKDAVEACSTEAMKQLVGGFIQGWRTYERSLKKADILWVARICGATPEETAAVKLLMPQLESGDSYDMEWWDDDEFGLLTLADSWDDFSEPSPADVENYHKTFEMPTSQEIDRDLELMRCEERHCEATYKHRNEKEW